MKKIVLIGSTGSIGRQVARVVSRYPERFKIVGLVAGSRSELFLKQVEQFKPEVFAAACDGAEKAAEIAGYKNCDLVFNAAGGFAGLKYSLNAIAAGKTLALANKESLVCGGEYVTGLANAAGVEIIPVDSEHSAIWQCLNFNKRAPFERLIITASGGAFRGRSYDSLKSVTPSEALNHPTWKMGAKITVDSATLMNKGYEVIEAHVLYNAPYGKITAVIQPQSFIHSMVEFTDGAIVAQMSYPTMELPIQLALSYPERLPAELKKTDFSKGFALGFEPLKEDEFPLYKLALQCGRAGGTLPCALNAADEVAVNAFLNGEIAFTDIYDVVNGVVQGIEAQPVTSYKQLENVDLAARKAAAELVFSIKNS